MAPPFTGMFLLVGLLLLPQSTLASTNEFIPSMSVSDAVDSDSSIPLANMANKMKESRISLKSNAPDCSSGSSSSSRYHALVCWLWNAQVTLPDESFQEELGTIIINEMTCTNFQLSSLSSSYTIPPPTSPALTSKNPTINLKLNGISANCSGKYSASLISGNVLATVGEEGDKGVELTVDVASAPLRGHGHNNTHKSRPGNDEELPFPTLATLTKCQTLFTVTNLQFTGSISSAIIGLFSGLISSKVSEALNSHVCEVMKKEGEKAVEEVLHRVGGYVADLVYDNSLNMKEKKWKDEKEVANEHESREDNSFDESEHYLNVALAAPKTDNSVRWSKDMPLLKRILSATNSFISTHLNEGIIVKFLQKLNTWPTTPINCQDCGFFFKGFNGLVRSLTNGSGAVDITIPETLLNFHHNYTFAVTNYGNVTVVARHLNVRGLDNLTSLKLFEPSGDNMLSSGISTDAGFNVSIILDLVVEPSNGGEFHADLLKESFEITFNVTDVNFTNEMALELDAEIYRRLSVGSFMFGSYTVFDSNTNVLNCILETLTSMVFTGMHTRMNLNVMHVVPIQSSKDGMQNVNLETDMDQLIDNVVQMLLLQYPATMTEALDALVQSPARSFINKALSNYISDSKKYPLHCVNVDIPNKKVARPMELDTNGAVVLFNEVVNKESTITAINAFIECVDGMISSANLFSGHFFNVSLGEYTLVFHDLQMDNMNSVYELGFLRPEVDHFHLANNIGVAKYDKNGDMTSVSFGMNILHGTHGSMGNVNVHAKMKDLRLNGGTELKFDMNWLPQLKIIDLLSHAQCVSIPATEARFYGFNATVEMLEVNIEVVLVGDKDPHTFKYVTQNPIELASAMSSLMTEGAVLLEEKMTKISNYFMEEDSHVCTSPLNPQRTHVSKRDTAAAGLWTFLIVLVFVAGNFLLFMSGFKRIHELEVGNSAPPDKHPNDQQEGERSNDAEFTSMAEPLIDRNDEGLDEVMEVESPPRKFPFASSSSLMFHPSTQSGVKFGFPVIITLALILFMLSNLSVGASVDMIMTRGNGTQVTSAINIYAFSLGSTMREMFQAGVYLLMLLILFCSGVWPYVKLLALMFCWMASTRRLPPIRREQILYLLDSLGKFSLIDAYVLVLMMVAFRYELKFANAGALNVYVTPKFGFYSFLFATIISLVSGHAMLFLHRRTLIPRIPQYSGRHESLSKHIFEDKHGKGLVKLTKRFRRTIVMAMLTTFILICVGVNLKCFHFTINGVAGTLRKSRVREYSLVSIGESIPQSVQDTSSFGIHWIQSCYFFFALTMPLVCLLSLFVLFVYPMTIKQQQKVFVIAEVSNAWSAVEVFVIAIIASLIEIAPFSQSMVGQHCSLLNQILSGWSGGDGNELHHCFGVKSSLDGSSAVLIIGVMLNSILISTLHRFAHHALWERIEREDRPDATEDETKTVRECCLAHTFVSKLRKMRRVGNFMFDVVSFGPHSEYEIDFENVAENEEPEENFWSEWRKIVSVI